MAGGSSAPVTSNADTVAAESAAKARESEAKWSAANADAAQAIADLQAQRYAVESKDIPYYYQPKAVPSYLQDMYSRPNSFVSPTAYADIVSANAERQAKATAATDAYNDYRQRYADLRKGTADSQAAQAQALNQAYTSAYAKAKAEYDAQKAKEPQGIAALFGNLLTGGNQ